MGLGLSQYLPVILYVLLPIVALLTIIRKVEIGIFFLVPLLPLHNIIEKIHKVGYGGKDFVDILVISMLIGWLIQKNKETFFEKTPLNKALFLLIISTFFGLLIGSMNFSEATSVIGFSNQRFLNWKNYMIAPLLYFIVVNNVRSVKTIKLLVLIMIASMIIIDLQFYNEYKWVKSWHFTYKQRVGGTFGYAGPNTLAAFYAQNTLLIICLFLFEKAKKMRLLFVSTIIFNLYCLTYTFSRGGYLAFLLGCVFIGWLKDKKIIVALLIFLVFWRSFVPVSVKDRVEMTRSEETEEGLEPSAAGRIRLWEGAIEAFLRNPILGTGYDTFRYFGLKSYGGDKKRTSTHNMFAQVLAELGIVGFLIFVYLFYIAFKGGWQLYKKTDHDFFKGLGLGFCTNVIACFTANMFGDRWTYLQISGYYWVFLALVVRANMIPHDRFSHRKPAIENSNVS